MRSTKIGAWHCTMRSPVAETWVSDDEEPETMQLVFDQTRPPGDRWTWTRGEASGSARTSEGAFSAALDSLTRPRPRGRPPRADTIATRRVETTLTPDEHARYTSALGPGETLADVIRERLEGWYRERSA
jgi:hypothetical protein